VLDGFLAVSWALPTYHTRIASVAPLSSPLAPIVDEGRGEITQLHGETYVLCGSGLFL